MLPVLFRVGNVAVPTHDFFVLLGVAAAAGVFFAEARRRDMADERLAWVVIGALLLGGIGARAGAALGHVASNTEAGVVGALERGGRTIVGGLAGAYVGAVITKRLVGYRERTGDIFAPAVALGMAVGRWGCFLTEQIGTPTSMPWGITVNPEIGAHIPYCPHCALGVPLHPSFIYEIVFHAAAFAALLWLRPRVAVKGDLLKIYLFAYALFRFVVEFVRGNRIVWAGLTGPQLFLIPTTILLLFYFWRQRSQGAHHPSAMAEAGAS